MENHYILNSDQSWLDFTLSSSQIGELNMKSLRPQNIIQSAFNVDFSVTDIFLCPLDLQLLCLMNLYPNMPCPSIED
jgi:hypothetical protein